MLVFLKILCAILLFFPNAAFSKDNAIEYKIKAAYLYNFTKFVIWPETPFKTFNLCIWGQDPFGRLINPMVSRSVNNKPIKIYRLESIEKATHCQIVYFGKSGKQWNAADFSVAGMLSITSQKNTLSVGESKYFAQAGGMIAFIFKEKKIKLQINLKAVKQSPLKISAQLLEVAELVNGEPNG